jgi:hypothetical protein
MRKFLVLALFVLPIVACDDPDLVPVRPSPVAAQVTLSAFPTALLASGSEVRVTVRVTTTSGANFEGRLTLATTAGTLDRTEAQTDASGQVTVILTSSEAATVTATVNGMTGSVAIPAVPPFTVAVQAPAGEVPVGAVDLPIVVTRTPGFVNPPLPASVTVDCGTGSALVDVTTLSAARCTFPSQARYTVTAFARASTGWTTTDRVTLTVVHPAAPVGPLSLALSTSHVGGTEWRIRASAGTPMRSFYFDFGDGFDSRQEFSGGRLEASAQHVFAQRTEPYTVRVTAQPADGRASVSQTVCLDVNDDDATGCLPQ